MNNYELPAWANTTMEIVSITMIIALCIFAMLLLIYMVDATIKSEKAKKDYIDTLNEHDKAVVMQYINSKKYPKWKKEQKQ